MARSVSLVLPDAGPLISLATADRLDLLDLFAVPLATLDVVKAECLFKDWEGRQSLERWFGRNEDRIEIIASPIMATYASAIERVRDGSDPSATRGLGDAAISWYVANAPFTRPRHTTTLVLTEDAAFGDSRLRRDVHVLSTRAFLQTLENLDVIDSARRILDDIERGGRKPAPYMADRPALVGASGKAKSSWASALKKSAGRET